MTPEQAKRFYRDGYLIIRGAVPKEQAMAARRLIFERLGGLRTAARDALRGSDRALESAVLGTFGAGGEDPFVDLYNKTPLKKILAKAMGARALPVKRAQLATLFPGDFGGATNESGYLNRDTPFHGWTGHLDGLWNGGTPVPRAGTNIRGKHLANWRSAPSTNGMFKYAPDENANMANFTALVGVALSDQRTEGVGNLGLLRGAHKDMEAFFRTQRDAGGPFGPEGPGWERENPDAPNRHGLVHYPAVVREKYAKEARRTKDGALWPKPDFMKLGIGDAVIVHALTPHSASLLTDGAEPRMMVYFRCTNGKRPYHKRRIYTDALCDALLEWKGVGRMLKK